MSSTAITLSRPTVNTSPDLDARLTWNGTSLTLVMNASRKLRVVELQGPRELLAAFGAERTSQFVERQFADDVAVPAGMRADIAFINNRDFRWNCDIGLAAGAEVAVAIPTRLAPSLPVKLGIVSVVYEYTRLLGLSRRKYGLNLAVGEKARTE
jgi:hypothetical protein